MGFAVSGEDLRNRKTGFCANQFVDVEDLQPSLSLQAPSDRGFARAHHADENYGARVIGHGLISTTWGRAQTRAGEIRSPKSEIRNKLETRNSAVGSADVYRASIIRISFELRISDLGFQDRVFPLQDVPRSRPISSWLPAHLLKLRS